MQGEERVRVWDIAVRVFHWSLVVLFFVAYLTGDEDSTLHVYAGYGVCALVAFRVLWGFVGTRHARFADFVRGRAHTVGYVKALVSLRPPHYLGHNPLGGWMVVALLACLTATCWSGLLAYAEDGKGPLAGEGGGIVSVALAHGDERRRGGGDGDGHGVWGEIHETISDLTLFLVFLHVCGVVVTSVMDRENLVKAMITGDKKRRSA